MATKLNNQEIERLNEIKFFAKTFPGAFYRICFLLIKIVQGSKSSNALYDVSNITEDLESVYDTIGKFNPLKPCGTKAAFKRLYVQLYENKLDFERYEKQDTWGKQWLLTYQESRCLIVRL